MNSDYKHTEYGTLMFIIFVGSGALIAFVFFAMLVDGELAAALIMVAIYLLGIAMFYNFTIEVSDRVLKFWFGIGIIKKTISLSEIQAAREVESPWYYFWGIKSIPGGWYYAISPGRAVEIVLKDGKLLRLGTDQPDELKKAIDSAARV